jgi:chromosome segregation protein
VFLKRATLHGFKSFADRTEFDFGAGVTGIVGPNGCGKSNVLDAVRWVLGAQSAKTLRGDKMLDVIFSGSRSRKPATFAEVELVFDNTAGFLRSDATEVAVGRVLYRSGESEYRLNGKNCRLKDIKELLLDTGVGVDAYSVIEQGRVDVLLQASPVQRREIFEEAAGISRYKVRRTEAQRKLERTQNNLLRLQDVIEELERRLRSVRLAAGKARNYQEYDARLRELRASFSMAEYHELEQRRIAIRAEIDELGDALQDERNRLAAADADAAELSQQVQQHDETIQAADEKLVDLQATVSTLAERIAQGERRLEELDVTRTRRQKQAEDTAQRRDALQQRHAAELDALSGLQQAETENETRVTDLRTQREALLAEAHEVKSALETERVAAFDAVRQASLLQNERTNLDQQRTRLLAQVERFATRMEEIAAELNDLTERHTGIDQRLDTLNQDTDALRTTTQQHDKTLARLDEDAVTLDQQVGQAKEQRSGLLSRLALLDEMERRYEGVDAGAQAVLAWRETDPQAGTVLGLVADLLRIDDPRVAHLQAVLATFEDHVVVANANAFIQAAHDRDTPPGRVNIFALDRINPRAISGGYANVPGVVARAADWVDCAPEHRSLAEHLLGRTIIVDTRDRALRLADQALAGYMFVTLDGWTIHGDGRIIFGDASAAGGLISRKTEIRQLRTELDDLEQRLVTLTRRRMEIEQAIGDTRLARQGTLEKIATLQREHAEIRATQVRLADQRDRLEREKGLTGSELETQRRSLTSLDAQRTRLAQQHADAGAAQHRHEEQVATLAAAVQDKDARLHDVGQALTAAEVELGRVSEKRAATAAALQDMQARAAALEEEAAAARREADEARVQIDSSQADLTAARQEEAEHSAAAEQQRRHLLELRQLRQNVRGQLEECGTQARTIQKRIEAGEAAVHEQQVNLREVEVRRDELVTRIRDELELDLTAKYAEYEHSEQDWQAIKAEIDTLRGKLARLGNVNLDAITELEELTPRYEHLVEQRTDLEAAIERLERLIADLDEESRTRFAATFNEVRGNFQEMFRKLFGGGKADIILEDPENPLECGIEIIARPPGKEPQSISLLSGGEKTMTAVGLLMAVFKSRPSPFAILDEVDAALDESNTERFNMLLQEFLSHSQFVVITHSKRTMASADVLYGVTMEEPGVSKRVSVRFDDRVQTPEVA